LKKISIVVPIFNEPNLPDLVPRLLALKEKIPDHEFEFIFVDDGSKDKSLENLLKFREKFPKEIKVVKLTRNFGSMAARQAGLKVSKGDCVGVISSDLQASLGIHQLERIGKNFERRKEIWNIYNKAFEDLPFDIPSEEKDTVHARHLYTLLLDIEKLKISRDEFMSALRRENIGTGVHYISLHLQLYYKETFGFSEDEFPNASYISERTVSIPFSAKLTEKDVQDVIDAIIKVTNHYMK